MRKFVRRNIARLPLRYRVLHRQFLLRVIDLEALSIEADIPRFLGQFAGVLMMISLMQALGTLMFPPPPELHWHVEQSAVSNMMLVIGLVAVLTWDNTFPDRRDAMILGPLPVKPGTILLAKITASASLLGVAILALNFASSGSRSLVFGGAAGLVRNPPLLRVLLVHDGRRGGVPLWRRAYHSRHDRAFPAATSIPSRLSLPSTGGIRCFSRRLLSRAFCRHACATGCSWESISDWQPHPSCGFLRC